MAAELVRAVGDDDASAVSTGDEAHVLVLGDQVFTCSDKMPFGTLMKYADHEADLITLHHLLTKLVHPDDHDRMWDAFDAVGTDEGSEAIGKVMESYTGSRPTDAGSPSSGGSARTNRK